MVDIAFSVLSYLGHWSQRIRTLARRGSAALILGMAPMSAGASIDRTSTYEIHGNSQICLAHREAVIQHHGTCHSERGPPLGMTFNEPVKASHDEGIVMGAAFVSAIGVLLAALMIADSNK